MWSAVVGDVSLKIDGDCFEKCLVVVSYFALNDQYTVVPEFHPSGSSSGYVIVEGYFSDFVILLESEYDADAFG